MLIRKEDMPLKKAQMRGGNGEIIQQIVVPAEQMIHARMFNRLVIKSGCSIGFHEHKEEVEYYYILQGEGVVTEKECKFTAKPGDVVITGWGASHSIANEGKDDLILLAVISTEN